MALPDQIRKQSEAVQKLYEELNTDPEAPPQGEGEQSDPPEPTQEPQASDAGEAPPNGQEKETPEPKKQVNPDAIEGEGFEQKYRTLQGMYNREVPRLLSQNRELGQRLNQMEQLLANMQEQQKSEPQPTAENTKPLVSDAEIEEYGPETVDLFRRLSRQETLPYIQKIAELEGTIKDLKTSVVPQVENVVQRERQTTQERFWADIDQAVPDWREINNNQDFHTWLLEYDPMYGSTRQELLEQAQSQFNSQRVVSFFETWKRMNPTHGQEQKAENSSSREELEKQVSPGKSRSASVPTTSEGRTYTPEDIREFFKDVSAGKYKGREDERNRIERDIFAAQQQGRIVANA